MLPLTTSYPKARRPDDRSLSAGVERLQTGLYRALGRVHPRPAALPDGLLGCPGGPEAGVWQPGQDGVHRISAEPKIFLHLSPNFGAVML